MKIIHSYWTKPNVKNQNFSQSDRAKGGWLHRKYNYYSWALSCLKLKEFYGKVELVTDHQGKSLLIDQLGLPYDQVSLALNDINDYHPDLWTLGKIYAASVQKEPFIHVDGDVYIWKKFPRHLEQAPLIAQNLEFDFPFYYSIMDSIEQHFSFIPTYLKALRNNYKGKIASSNTGIFGGTDLNFFSLYFKEAIEFINKNIQYLKHIDIGRFILIFEQCLFHSLAHFKSVKVNYLLENISHQYEHLSDFYKVPAQSDFIHVIGVSRKNSLTLAEQLAFRLRLEYPAYYHKINHLLDESAI